MDRINSNHSKAKFHNRHEKHPHPGRHHAHHNSKRHVEDTKNSASNAMNIINEQRAPQNQVHYDFSHFNDDQTSDQSIKFLA